MPRQASMSGRGRGARKGDGRGRGTRSVPQTVERRRWPRARCRSAAFRRRMGAEEVQSVIRSRRTYVGDLPTYVGRLPTYGGPRGGVASVSAPRSGFCLPPTVDACRLAVGRGRGASHYNAPMAEKGWLRRHIVGEIIVAIILGIGATALASPGFGNALRPSQAGKDQGGMDLRDAFPSPMLTAQRIRVQRTGHLGCPCTFV